MSDSVWRRVGGYRGEEEKQSATTNATATMFLLQIFSVDTIYRR